LGIHPVQRDLQQLRVRLRLVGILARRGRGGLVVGPEDVVWRGIPELARAS
jgi:hypothetical protein